MKTSNPANIISPATRRTAQYGMERSVETSQGKVGGLVEQILLICYHYDPARGKYGAAIFNVLRLSALATMLVLGGFMFIMFRRDAAARLKATGKDCAESGVDAT